MLIYFCLSGILSLIKSYFLIKENDEETQELLKKADFALEGSGFDSKSFIYIISLLIGFIIVPIYIIRKIYKFTTGKDLFPKD